MHWCAHKSPQKASNCNYCWLIASTPCPIPFKLFYPVAVVPLEDRFLLFLIVAAAVNVPLTWTLPSSKPESEQ